MRIVNSRRARVNSSSWAWNSLSRAAQRLLQEPLDALAQGGVVAVARDVDEAGDEAGVGVRAHEQAQLLPVLEVQDLASTVASSWSVGVWKQLVARIGLEDVGQGLAGVAAGREAGPLLDQRHLAPQERDRARVQAVGGGGEEAQEAVLAHDQAIGAEALDADIVEIGGAVDGAARRWPW